MASVNQVFSSFTQATLERITQNEDLFIESEGLSKSKLVEALSRKAEETGFNLFTAELSREELEQASKIAKIDYGEVKNPTKSQMRKRLHDKMMEAGLVKFIDKFDSNDDLLSAFADITQLDGKVKAKDVAREIGVCGTEAILTKFDVPTLKQYAEEMGIKVKTTSKPKILKALATKSDAKKEEKSTIAKARAKADKEAEEAASKDKPAIKKGVTYQDIFQHYVLPELVTYCKDNNIKVSGRKSDVIKRIIAFLNGDQSVLAVPKEKKESKKGDKKTESKSSPKKKTSTPKKSKKDEAEAPAEEEKEKPSSGKKGGK